MARGKKNQQQESRTPPHSAEAERAILGAMIQFTGIAVDLAPKLSVEDFFGKANQLVFQSILDLVEKAEPVDIRTVQAKLQFSGNLQEVGGLAYLEMLDFALPDPANCKNYAAIIQECSRCRRLIEANQKTIEECFGGVTFKEAIENSERRTNELAALVDSGGFVRYGVLAGEVIKNADENGGKDTKTVVVDTGFYDFDRMTRGLVGGNLIIIAGRPGMGKTSFAMNIAQNIAFRQGGCVGVVSLEMGSVELVQRVLASEANVPYQSVRSAELSDGQWARLIEAAKRTSPGPMWIDDTANMTTLELCAKARKLKKEQGLIALIVDYLQLMKSGSKNENRQTEVAEMTRTLKQLAKELNIPVIVLSQLSRNTERRGNDHRPQVADLRESGAIEQDADIVAFVYRDEVYFPDDPENRGKAELIVAKHRGGPLGTVELVFHGETTSFRSLDTQHVFS